MLNLQSVVVVSCPGTETAGKIRFQIKLHSAVQMQGKLTKFDEIREFRGIASEIRKPCFQQRGKSLGFLKLCNENS